MAAEHQVSAHLFLQESARNILLRQQVAESRPTLKKHFYSSHLPHMEALGRSDRRNHKINLPSDGQKLANVYRGRHRWRPGLGPRLLRRLSSSRPSTGEVRFFLFETNHFGLLFTRSSDKSDEVAARKHDGTKKECNYPQF